MGNDFSLFQEDYSPTIQNGMDPPAGNEGCDYRSVVSHRENPSETSASVATEKIRNIRTSTKGKSRAKSSGRDSAKASGNIHPEPVFRTASQEFQSESLLTPKVESATIQRLKLKAYQAILLHASATGRNAVLNLNYNVSIESCGPDASGKRVIVTAQGTPTVIVQEIPFVSQGASTVPLTPVAVPTY